MYQQRSLPLRGAVALVLCTILSPALRARMTCSQVHDQSVGGAAPVGTSGTSADTTGAPLFRYVPPSQFDGLFRVDIHNVRDHISPEGYAGAVAAAESRTHPNYFRNWIRDAAEAYQVMFNLYLQGDLNWSPDEILKLMTDYFDFTQKITKIHPRGFPLVNMDGSAIEESEWGWPQNCGPALRASSFVTAEKVMQKIFDEGHLDKEKLPLFRERIFDLVAADVAYTATQWQENTFDSWEEVKSKRHFFTLMVQRRALLEGARLARRMGKLDKKQQWEQVANQISEVLRTDENFSKDLIEATSGRSGGIVKPALYDMSVILGVLLGKVKGQSYGVDEPRVIATLWNLEKTFERILPINHNRPKGNGVMFSRWEGDGWTGFKRDAPGSAHFWFLTTFAASEFYYDLAETYREKKSVVIDARTISAFESILQEYTPGPGEPNVALQANQELQGKELQVLISALREHGDGIMKTLNYHRYQDGPRAGQMGEQGDKWKGEVTGPERLTWSHVNAIRAFLARRKLVAALWQEAEEERLKAEKGTRLNAAAAAAAAVTQEENRQKVGE
ncbi:MAG: hypothetical protein C5B49_13870 [Bdellovibrio sp.]|nr:MAG: hypothetical protein C5B49_13870 [Bdellovibrio sp.]